MALNLKPGGACGLCCISLLPSEVTCVVSALGGRSPLGLCHPTSSSGTRPRRPFSPVFSKQNCSAALPSHVGPNPADNLWQALHSLLWLDLLKSKECLVVVQKHAWKKAFARSNPEAPDSAKPLNMCLRLTEFFGEGEWFPGLWTAT